MKPYGGDVNVEPFDPRSSCLYGVGSNCLVVLVAWSHYSVTDSSRSCRGNRSLIPSIEVVCFVAYFEGINNPRPPFPQVTRSSQRRVSLVYRQPSGQRYDKFTKTLSSKKLRISFYIIVSFILQHNLDHPTDQKNIYSENTSSSSTSHNSSSLNICRWT